MKISVCSYNIHSGKNIFHRPTLQKMIRFFRRNPIDILAVQEIHQNSKHGWQVDVCKNQLEMETAFAGNVLIKDGYYGIAIFSRFPILKSEHVKLTSQKEQRGLLHLKLKIDGSEVNVLNTHLGLGRKERMIQLNELEDLISSDSSPTLLFGDFNSSSSLSLPPLIDLGKKAGKEELPTFFPLRKRIDFIFTSPSFQLVDYDVIPVQYSDHYPVRASLVLRQ